MKISRSLVKLLIVMIAVLSLMATSNMPVLAAPAVPAVSSQYPTAGSTDASISVKPYLVFNKSIDPTTVNTTNIQLMDGVNPVAATVALSGTKKVIITPAAPLAYSTKYHLVATTGIEDITNTPMANDYGTATTSQFITAPLTHPEVVSQYPAAGAEGVGVSIKPYILFSKSVDPTTITSTTVHLMNGDTAVAATVTLSRGKRVTISPTSQLNKNTTYFILVDASVKDTEGNSMLEGYGADSTSEFSTVAPLTPSISSQYPLAGATGVPINVKPYVVFSKAMDPTTINSTNIQLMSGEDAVNATVTLSGKYKAIITPAAALSYNTAYYLVVTTDVKDTDGYSITAEYGSDTASRFTTTVQTAPTIESQYPAAAATDVDVNVQPSITFSVNMDPSTIDSSTVKLMQGVTIIEAVVDLHGGDTAIITPVDPLDFETVYHIAVTTGVKDIGGNALETAYGAADASQFTTTSNTPPQVVFQYPASGASGVPITIQPCVVFSDNIDSTTVISNNIKLMNGTTAVKASLALYGKRMVIITPFSALTPNTTYHIAVNTRFKDTTGVAMVADYGSVAASQFTTAAAVPLADPSQYPAAGAVIVEITTKPYVVFAKTINPTTVSSNTVQLMNANGIVRSSAALSGGNTIIITPAVPLSYSTLYYIVVTTGVKDTAGNTLAAAFGSNTTSQFTTEAEPATPLEVLAQYPVAGAIGVAVSVKPCVIFSEDLDPTTVTAANIRLMNGINPVAATVILSGKNAVIITPSVSLTPSQIYWVSVSLNVKDMDGETLAGAYGAADESQFTTAANSALTVANQYPEHADTGISVNVQPLIVFARDIDPTTVNTTNIKLMDGTDEVAITVALYGKNVVIITPAAPLDNNKTYHIVVTTGVKDTSGNVLADDYGSDTTTEFVTEV